MRNPISRLRHDIADARRGYRKWLSRRAIERGRSPLPERVTRPIRTSMPIYRNQINPATGCPHRYDMEFGTLMDRHLARVRERRSVPVSAEDAWERGLGTYRPPPARRGPGPQVVTIQEIDRAASQQTSEERSAAHGQVCMGCGGVHHVIGRVMDESLARRARRAQERAGQPRTKGRSQ